MSSASSFASAPMCPDTISELRSAVRDLRDRGLSVCRVRRGEKTPDHPGWPAGSLQPDDFSDGDSVGIVCGWPSDGNIPEHALICIDLDHANAVAMADRYLPPTGVEEGRPGKQRSHRYFLVPVRNLTPDDTSTAPVALSGALAAGKHPGPRSRRFAMPDGTEALALKGTGAQAVCPPSSHPSGEIRQWEGGNIGVPAIIEYRDLLAACERLAAAVGCRPGSSGRQNPVGPRPVQMQQPREGRGGTPEQLTLLVSAQGKESVQVGGRAIGLNERVERGRRYLAGIPDDGLSRSGMGGHATLFRHARILTNDFLIRDRSSLEDLFAEYNQRLRTLSQARPGEGFEPWSLDEMAHKLDDALDGGVTPEFLPGCKLSTGTSGDEPPRAWDDPARLANEFLDGHEIRFIKRTPFIYQDGCYVVTSLKAMTARVRMFVEGRSIEEYQRLSAQIKTQRQQAASGAAGSEQQLAKLTRQGPPAVPRVSIRLVDEVIDAVQARRQLPDEQKLDVWLTGGRAPILGVTNGLLNLQTRQLTPHSPEWFSTTQLPVPFDPSAPPPTRFMRCLGEWTCGDATLAAVLQEIVGACLDVHLRVKFFALLVGEGENGKSVFLRVLRALLGSQNVASVGLDDLVRNRFAMFGLMGKLANLVGDQGYVELADEGKLKQLTGGDVVAFEQKNRDPIFAVNSAKIVVAANTPPTFSDKSKAVWTRLQIVPFDHVVPPDRRDPTLVDEQTWAGELPGILNWALEGLARLHQNRGFTDCPRVRAARARHKIDSDPAQGFLLERYRAFQGGGFFPTDEIYSAYREWCDKTGHTRPLTIETFSREIPRTFPGVESDQVRNASSRRRGWWGLVAIPTVD